MYPPEKHLRNEKLKDLLKDLEAMTEDLVTCQANLTVQVMMTQMMMHELISLLIEPEEPG